MTNRIGDAAYFQNLMFHLRKNQADFNQKTFQGTSEKKSQHFSGISNQASRLISLKNYFERTDQFIKNIDLVEDRLTTMESSIDQIKQLAIDFNTQLTSALNDQNASAQKVNLQADSALQDLLSILNKRINGRYVFGGTEVSRSPVDIEVAEFARPPSAEIPSQVNTAYYQGNHQPLQVVADEGVVIDYQITADATGFEKLMRVFNLVRSADIGPPSDRARLNEAKRLVQEAGEDLSTLQTRIGAVQTEISRIGQSHEDLKLILGRQISDIENVDPIEISVQLADTENTLRASYSTIVRASRLSILNYL